MERISEALVPFTVDLSTLDLDPLNARAHGARNLAAISSSLQRFGQQKPVVLDGSRVIAGNGTVLAARSLGWSKIAAVQQSGLSSDEIRAFAIADNKTAELATWEYAMLANTLRDLPDDLRLFTGFAEYEIQPLLDTDWKPPAEEPGNYEAIHSIRLTADQFMTFKRAAEKIRQDEGGGDEISDGRVVELLAAEFLA